MRKLIQNQEAFDIWFALGASIVFSTLMVLAFLIWSLQKAFVKPGTGVSAPSLNRSIGNLTGGWDSSVKIIILSILIACLSVALAYILLLRGHPQ